MTSDANDPLLDQLLHDWSKQLDVDSASPQELQQRILRAAMDEPSASQQSHDQLTASPESQDNSVLRRQPPPEDGSSNSWHWSTRLALAVVVSFVGIWLWRQTGSDKPTIPALTEPRPPDVAWMRAEQLAAKSQLLRELERVYDQQVEWFTETSNRLELDLRPSLHGSPNELRRESPVAIRVVVQKRPLGSARWHVEWAMDVVTRNEQLVRLPTPSSTELGISLWSYRLPDGMIHVESEVTLPGQEGLHARSAAVLSSGQPVQVYSHRTERSEYRMFQLAALLPADVG